MLRIESVRHKANSLCDHLRQHLFSTLVDHDDIVEIDNPIFHTGGVLSRPPAGEQSSDRVSRKPPLANPSLLGRKLLHCDSQHPILSLDSYVGGLGLPTSRSDESAS